MTLARSCKHTKSDGQACRALAIKNSDYCFFHDPACEEQRREAVILGGKARKTRKVLEPVVVQGKTLRTGRDVIKLLEETINQARTGELDPGIANTIGHLSNVLLRAIEVGELEQRLLTLEMEAKEIG